MPWRQAPTPTLRARRPNPRSTWRAKPAPVSSAPATTPPSATGCRRWAQPLPSTTAYGWISWISITPSDAPPGPSFLEQVADFAQQGDVFRGGRGRFLGFRFAARHVDRLDHPENDEGQENEVDDDGNEIAPGENDGARLGQVGIGAGPRVAG